MFFLKDFKIPMSVSLDTGKIILVKSQPRDLGVRFEMIIFKEFFVDLRRRVFIVVENSTRVI